MRTSSAAAAPILTLLHFLTAANCIRAICASKLHPPGSCLKAAPLGARPNPPLDAKGGSETERGILFLQDTE